MEVLTFLGRKEVGLQSLVLVLQLRSRVLPSLAFRGEG